MLRNETGFIDPAGNFHPTDGLTHSTWAVENLDLLGDGDIKLSGDNTIVDYFIYFGWIRVIANAGIEIRDVNKNNIELVKKIMTIIAKDNPGKTLYIDPQGRWSIAIPVDMRGRPDFREIELSKNASNIRNEMGLVDPQGKFHPTNGLSHPDWAHINRSMVGFVPRIVPQEEDEQERYDDENASRWMPYGAEKDYFDAEGSIALDHFLNNGWIRVKPNNGISLSGLYKDNIELVKKIIRIIAKSNPGRTLYVDDGNSTKYIRVDMRGRPDFSEIENIVEKSGVDMFKKLTKLADYLDQKGFVGEADFIDGLIKKLSQMEEIDENEGQCDFEVDECHSCWAICGEKEWLCAHCKQLAQRMGLTEKQFAYDDPEGVSAFEQEEMLESDRPIVEDLTGESDEFINRTPGRN